MATSTAIIRLLMQKQGTGVEDAGRELDNLIKKNTQTTSQMVQAWNRTAQQIGGSMRQLGQAFMNAGMMATMYLTVPIVAAGKDFVKSAADFGQAETALRAVTSQSDATASGFKTVDEAVKSASNNVLDWSKNYTYSAADALKTTLFVKEAGINNLQFAEAVTKKGAALSTATRDMSERTSQGFTEDTLSMLASVRLFHGELFESALAAGKSDEAIKILNKDADVMAIVANNSAGRFAQLKESMERAAPSVNLISKQYKASFDEIEAAGWGFAGTMKSVGIIMDKGITSARGGTEFGTGVRTMFTTGRKAAEELGVTLTDTNGKIKSQQDILAQLNQALFGQVKASGNSAVATEKQAAASDKLKDSLSKLLDTQLSASARTADQISKLKGQSKAEVEAYKVAQEAMRGSAAEVAKKTQALRDNASVFDKLTPKMRDDIMLMNTQSEAALKNQLAYDKLKGSVKFLTNANGKLTESERLAYATKIFGAVGMKALIPLIEAGTEAQDKYTKAIDEGGSAEGIAQDKLNNFKDAWAKFQVLVDNVMIKTLGPILAKYLKPLVAKLTELVDQFDKLPQPVKEAAVWFGVFLAALGPILVLIGGFLFTVGMTIQGLSGLATVISTAIIPQIGALTLVFAPLLAIFTLVGLGIAGVASALIDNTNGIRDKMAGPLSTVMGYLGELKAWFDDKIPKALAVMKSFFTNIGEKLLSGINFKAIFDEIEKLRKAMGDLFAQMFGKDASVVVEVRSNEVAGGAADKRTEVTKLQKQAEDFGGGIGKVLSNITNTIVPGFIKAITDVTSALSEHMPKWVEMSNQSAPKIIQSGKDLQTAFDNLSKSLGLFALSGEGGSGFSNMLDLMTSLADLGNKISVEMFTRLADAVNYLAKALQALKTGDFVGTIASLTDITIKTTPAGWFGELIFGKQTASGTLDQLRKSRDDIVQISSDTKSGVMNEWGLLPEAMQVTTSGMRLGVAGEFSGLYNDLVGQSIVPDIVNGIMFWVNTLKTQWDFIWNDMVFGASTTMTTILSYVGTFGATIQPTWDAMVTSLSTPWNNFWNSIATQVTTILGTDVTKAIQDQFSTFQQLGTNLIGQITKGIEDAAVDMINSIVEAVRSAIHAAQKAIAEWGGGGKTTTTAPTGRASGGPVRSGQTYVVGETGPELFTPKMSGNIIPNGMLNAMNGGTTNTKNTTYQLNYQGGNGSLTEADLRHMFEMMEMNSNLNPGT